MQRMLIGMIALAAMILPVASVQAYSYAGYRWGGSAPSVGIDTSGLLLTSWRAAANDAMNSWNNAGAKLTFHSNSSSANKMDYYWQVSEVLAYAPTERQYRWWGNVVKGYVHVNNYHNFNPPYGSGHDLRSVLRHEFGHWLVLWHVENPSALMYHSLPAGQVKHLSSDEVNAIRNIYGTR